MKFIESLYNHSRWKLLFTNQPDIIELFCCLGSLFLSIDLFIESTYYYPVIFKISNINIDGLFMAQVFLGMSIVQFISWYINNIQLRRLSSLINGLSWFIFSVFISFGGVAVVAHEYYYFIGSVSNIWLYLRLGLLKVGIGK